MSEDNNRRNDNEILDKDLALENLGGDEDLFREILQIYLDDVAKRMRLLHEALDGSNCEGIRFEAHAIKGASANIGAVSVREISSDIEQAGRDNRVDAVAELVERLEIAFSMLESRIDMEIDSE